jgi:small subunit ribosomal protein S6
MLVLHPDLPEAQTRETIERARRLLEGMGAEVHGIDEWGMRDLAYAIRKVHRGYYVVAEYSSKPAAVNELERTLRLSDEILRYVTVVRSATRRRASAMSGRSREEGRRASDGAPFPVEAEMSDGAQGAREPLSDADSESPGAEIEGRARD